MVALVYRDIHQDAPRVKWLGITFLDGVPVEVSDPEIIAKASGNRFFTVSGSSPAHETEEAPVAPAKRGWPAGKPRKAPV
jgi:hypothetical protein